MKEKICAGKQPLLKNRNITEYVVWGKSFLVQFIFSKRIRRKSCIFKIHYPCHLNYSYTPKCVFVSHTHMGGGEREGDLTEAAHPGLPHFNKEHFSPQRLSHKKMTNGLRIKLRFRYLKGESGRVTRMFTCQALMYPPGPTLVATHSIRKQSMS